MREVYALSSVSQVKGTTAVNQLAYLKATFGEQALERFRDHLPSEVKPYYEQPSAAMRMPISAVKTAYQVINGLYGDGTPAIYREIGRFGALKDLPKFFKGIVAVANPELVFKFLGSMWRLYYNTGRIEVALSEPNHLVVHLVGFEDAGEEICNDIAGFSQALLEQLRIVDPRVRHIECSSKGAPYCVFEGTWKDI